jgi:hypothetical protein
MDTLLKIATRNPECSFTQNIKESSATEGRPHLSIGTEPAQGYEAVPDPGPGPGPGPGPPKERNNRKERHRSLVRIVMSQCEPLYATIPPKERSLFVTKRVMEICSEIEEAKETYEAYRFNPKLLKISEIQRGLQLSLSDPTDQRPLSLLCFLNEYYQRHLHLVCDQHVFPTTVKRLEPLYLSYDKGQYSAPEIVALDLSTQSLGGEGPWVSDLKKGNLYLVDHPGGPLNPASAYKLPELQEIASQLSVERVNSTGKKKNKRDLYEDIYVHLVNH